ncbi:MAG: hypothetical protein SOW23_06580 [Eubacteriales bacterium]|nr:hypothetical protein [Eubacteriales bacterium]MDY2601444.1 hypothetical protein [Eubacteriales bacterium]
MSEKKLSPQAKFERDNCTRVSIKLVNTTDADILAHLAKLPNKQGYIKALIRADMNKNE